MILGLAAGMEHAVLSPFRMSRLHSLHPGDSSDKKSQKKKVGLNQNGLKMLYLFLCQRL